MAPGPDAAVLIVEAPALPGQRLLFGGEFQPGGHLQGAFPGGAVFHRVHNSGGIFLPGHTHPALHQHAAHLIAPAGGVLHGKAAYMPPAVLRRLASGKALGGQKHRPVFQMQTLPQPMHQCDAPVGRRHRRHQNTLVAPGHGECSRGGAIASQTVGQKEADLLGPLRAAKLLFSVYKLHTGNLRPVHPDCSQNLHDFMPCCISIIRFQTFVNALPVSPGIFGGLYKTRALIL